MYNGCMSDDTHSLPYVAIGERPFGKTGIQLVEYKSLRGTSKVEALHSYLAKMFYLYNNMNAEVFDYRLFLAVIKYNRHRQQQIGKRVPPDHMMASEVEMMGADAVKALYPDFSLVEDSIHVPLPITGVGYALQQNAKVQDQTTAAKDQEDDLTAEQVEEMLFDDIDAIF